MGRKKLEDKKTVMGALPDGPHCIDDILGRRYFMYTEANEKDYQTSLEKMNLGELQRHAIEIGNIIPSCDKRDNLIGKLVKIYLERKYKYVANAQYKQVKQPEPTPEVLEILSRGK